MDIVLSLPEELGARAREEASRRSQLLEDYLVEAIAGSVPPAQRIARSLEILDSLDAMGDEEDHRETYEALRRGEEEGGLSVRRRLP